ncbi:MAG TPA: hypothetical protein VKD91_22480 [Pyrinomonadaceae bacterium]|nr:hypothetical protein [Pyrinomonadaceae bacterium]
MKDSIQAPHPSGRKCASCGLVNAHADETCRRCGHALATGPPASKLDTAALVGPKKRGLWKRVTWVVGTTGILLLIFYASLLLSSESLTTDKQKKVQSAIYLIRKQGFTREAFVLNRLTSFRGSDNWLNKYVGHHDAYAATNFPFEIVTLYPEFFEVPVDDCERAAVLLHEARHLLGDKEDAALENTWKTKRQLGWTSEKYGQTRVWDATMRLTKARFPYMFECGGGGQSDCF